MIILDTNVLSELMKSQPNTSVNATLATRNVDDFEECDLEIINPWE